MNLMNWEKHLSRLVTSHLVYKVLSIVPLININSYKLNCLTVQLTVIALAYTSLDSPTLQH